MELRALSYAKFGQLLEKLTSKVMAVARERRLRIDAVAPILRSGALPGCHLAAKLGVVTVLPLQYKHTYDRASPIQQHFKIPKLTKNLATNATILIVDTNTVTGEIARSAVADVRARYRKARLVSRR